MIQKLEVWCKDGGSVGLPSHIVWHNFHKLKSALKQWNMNTSLKWQRKGEKFVQEIGRSQCKLELDQILINADLNWTAE